ncbi:hypothetical protein LNV08_16235 [Paucibacter sp. TC2R-5]|uniref:hypothetical protein n=1 Tax=Paucibacter sp. TC2R-5 TaxID=2893555 RepID=UPI0021E445F8|nr:hypothetical protein [Paucibacter sp. TC2R-5]MCV2360525.1 hypothetical protein [Paucibacter sp. TC2R-5]
MLDSFPLLRFKFDLIRCLPKRMKSNDLARAAFEAELQEVARVIASGPKALDAPPDVEAAFAALAALLGGVTLARAVSTLPLAQAIATSVVASLCPNKRD